MTTIANEILAQLGGNRFAAMTGAKNFIAHADGLSFKLPARFARDGINHVRVTLTDSDLYDVTFSKFNARKLELSEVAKRDGLYNDNLQAIFTEVTGLDTRI